MHDPKIKMVTRGRVSRHPTEPSLLIKLHDKKHRDGVMDRPGGEKGLFGHKSGEGRTAGKTVVAANEGRHPNPIAYAPEASATTSPVPDKPERGLTVYEEDVAKARKGELFPEKVPGAKPSNKHEHRYDSVELQSQSAANPNNLANEFRHATGQGHKAFKSKIFGQVSAVGRDLADDPSLTENSEKIKSRTDALDRAVDEAKQAPKAQDNQQLQNAIDLAHHIVKEIIKTMTSDELKKKWHELKELFDEIDPEGAK